MVGKFHQKCGTSAGQKDEPDKKDGQSRKERNCAPKNVVEYAVPRCVGTGPREAWGRSRTRRGLRRDQKWRRERCRQGGSVRNSDGAIAIRAQCRETDLSQRRGEVLTTRPTFKPKFHKCFDNIMPASFGVRQSETALARSGAGSLAAIAQAGKTLLSISASCLFLGPAQAFAFVRRKPLKLLCQL